MPLSKKKKAQRANSKKFVKETREKILAKVGYTALKLKHGKSMPPSIPDYTVESKYPLSDTIGNGFKRKSGAQHPDAMQFPVGHDHKGSLRLIVATDDLAHMSGKKPN